MWEMETVISIMAVSISDVASIFLSRGRLMVFTGIALPLFLIVLSV